MSKGVQLTNAELQVALDAWAHHEGNHSRAAASVGMSMAGFQKRVDIARKRGMKPGKRIGDPFIALRAELQQAESRIRSLESNALTDAYVRTQIFKLRDGDISPPSWLSPARTSHKDRASSWHFIPRGMLVDVIRLAPVEPSDYEETVLGV